MTRTFAIAEVTEATYREVERLLRTAGYEHAINDGVIDMHGIALRIKKAPRFKVWTIEPDGEPGTLLLRTGSNETGCWDVPFAGDSPLEVARFARDVRGTKGRVVVRNYDTDAWHTVLDDGTVLDGKVPA